MSSKSIPTMSPLCPVSPDVWISRLNHCSYPEIPLQTGVKLFKKYDVSGFSVLIGALSGVTGYIGDTFFMFIKNNIID